MEQENERLADRPHGRSVSLPNTSGFWTDVALARAASQSASIEIQVACLRVMGMRAQSEIPTPKTPWDDMLAEMKWLREDFRCEPGRREAFFREISGPCIQEAHRRLSSTSEGKGWAPGLEPSVPEWAKKEYLVQTLLRQATQPEPAYEAEKDVGVDVTTRFSKPLPTRKRKTQSESGVRRSKRLRHLDADATDEDNVQND